VALVQERRSQVVLGLDPDPGRLWPAAVEVARGLDSEAVRRFGPEPVAARTAAAVSLHCRAVIEAAGRACVAVKLQLACFERLGTAGWEALRATAGAARAQGLLVIADGKRGDVPVTARAYAQALVGATPGPFGEVAGLGADAITVNPLLGRDSLEPFVEAAGAAGAGVFCLVRTSNPGAAEFQDAGAPGSVALHERLADLVADLGSGSVGACGLSAVGAVTGATSPDLLARLRELMPEAVFLLPGIGAQGGRVEDLGAAWAPHPAAGLVAASRSVVDAHGAIGGDPGEAAAAAAERLRDASLAGSGAEL